MGKDAVFTYFRESDPRFKDLNDTDLESFIRYRYPQFSTELDSGSAKSVAASRPKLAGTAKEAAARGLGIQTQATEAEYQQDIANAKAKFASDVAVTIPVAATLATGGLAAPVAMGVMGAAGGAQGAVTEAGKLGALPGMGGIAASDAAESPKQVARRLAVDVVLGAGMEGGVRLTGTLLEAAGNKVWKPLVARAAEKSAQGQNVLNFYGEAQLDQLRNMFAAAGSPTTNLTRELDTLKAHIARSETGKSEAFKDAWSNMAQKIDEWVTNGATAGGLMKLKGEVSQIAYRKEGLHFTEKNALRQFSEQIDEKAARLVRQHGGPQGTALYEGYKETQEQIKRFSASLELSEKFAKRFAYRTAYGFALGTGAGFGGGGDIGSMTTAAAAGAAIGAGAEVGMLTFERYIAPALLKHVLADKTAAPLAKRAINSMLVGDAKTANDLFKRAAVQVGAKAWLEKAAQAWAEEDAAAREMAVMAKTPTPVPAPTPTPGQ